MNAFSMGSLYPTTTLSPFLAHVPINECAPLLEYRGTLINRNV